MTTNTSLRDWVEQTAKLTQPDRIHWCNGSDIERDELVQLMLGTGDLIELNQATFPNCYLHRSNPSDVARVEHLTFICTPQKEDAGPNNNWMDPAAGHKTIDALFDGCMKGRTMYVVPYCMGPINSPYSRCGVEITDSPYVVLNMRIMTRMGAPALHRIEKDGTFVKGLHSIGDLDPDKRFIMHFPEELSIKSIGSGYGGNALLGKKCHALRIASFQARTEGWLAEHMLIVGMENPRGEVHYILGAFPSACGKTNLGMLIPPDTMPGWKVWTIGEDIAWLHVGSDGRLRAINPEAGFFGVVPGTSPKTNRNAYEMIHHDTIFTNVALTADNEPWWEGRTSGTPVIDWQGKPYDKATAKTPAAHPNSRFTVSAKQNPRLLAPDGAPGRRADLGDPVRRPPPRSGPAGVRSPRLGARRDGRRRHGVGDDRRGRGPGGRGAPRLDGDEAVLRLQLRRLLVALAQLRGPRQAAAEDLPRQLVPPGQGRQVPVAGLRRQPARAVLDHRSLRRPRTGEGNADRLPAAPRGHRPQGPEAERRRAAAVDRHRHRPPGTPRSTTSASTSTATARGCRQQLKDKHRQVKKALG